MYGIDENSVIKGFSTACFIAMAVLLLITLGLEVFGENGLWLAYRAFEFALYGIFALGLYKIILLLSQLIGEMKFFRQHYIQKDTKTAKVLERGEDG